ncbi:hypothetical protein AX15_007729, partial [Amanita polypyramis BW_CC]
KVATTPAKASQVPKSVCLCKVCMKQGTKANATLLCPHASGPCPDSSSLPAFVASKPLSECSPVSHAITLHGDWLLHFVEPLTPSNLQQLQAAEDQFHHPGSKVINWPTSASLKFPHVPTIQPDSSLVTNQDLLAALCSHPCWQDVSFISNPQFIWPTGHQDNLLALYTAKCGTPALPPLPALS